MYCFNWLPYRLLDRRENSIQAIHKDLQCVQKQRQMINICDTHTYIDIIGSAIIAIELCVLFSMWRK